MEAAIRAKENPLKLAETRLENRTFRPHVELCRDEPQDGLTMEVQALKDTIHQLNVKLDHSRYVNRTNSLCWSVVSSQVTAFLIILVFKTFLLFRETLTELEAHLHKLEEDHKNKQLALALDTRLVTNINLTQLSARNILKQTDAWTQGRGSAVMTTRSVPGTTRLRN